MLPSGGVGIEIDKYYTGFHLSTIQFFRRSVMVLSRRRFLTWATTTLGMTLSSPFFKRLQAIAINNKFVDLNTLFLFLERQGNRLIVKSEIRKKNYTYLVSDDAEQFIQDMEDLYLRINRADIRTNKTISLIKSLSNKILAPIDLWVAASNQICWVINENYIRFPLDILNHNETPLFLQKPVYYSFSKLIPRFINFSDKLSALIISDETADPEEGAYFVKNILPSSDYYNISDINLVILNTIPDKDLILISAHGAISFNKEDYIILGQEKLYPWNLSRLNPKLVYLDSCQLGASYKFIQAFRETQTNYYIAPITSNEAGNSSTRTIQFFFEYFKAGLSPEFALFYTRKDLYNYFKYFNNWEMLIWRAFPFRIYQLN